jgi:hypothetical protein
VPRLPLTLLRSALFPHFPQSGWFLGSSMMLQPDSLRLWYPQRKYVVHEYLTALLRHCPDPP